MTLQQALAFLLVAATMVGFVWGRLRYDLVALLALLVGLMIGVIPAKTAFDGFKNDVVVIIACALIVSAAIARSGIIEAATRPVLSRLNTEQTQGPVLTGASILLSMMTKNVGALAILMPSALQVAARTKTSPGRLLMPMSFGALVGGLVTLVGTSTNIIVSQIREHEIGRPFQMFDFAPVGLSLSLICLVYLSFAYRLLPKTRPGGGEVDAKAAAASYAAEVSVPEDWDTARTTTIADLQARARGEVKVTMHMRGDRSNASPTLTTRLKAGDILMLEGDQVALEQLIAATRLKVVPARRVVTPQDAKEEVREMEAVVAPDSALIGASVGSIGLHRNFGVNLLAVGRAHGRITGQLRALALRAGDVLVLQASERALPATLAQLGVQPIAQREPRLGLSRTGVPALMILSAAMILAALKIAPVAVAFFGAAVAMIAIGALSMRQVYQSLDGQVLVLVAALIPVSEAVQRTGGTALVAHLLSQAFSDIPSVLALALIMLAAMLASPFLHNAPTVLILGPVAVGLARQLGLSPDAFLMAVATGAGCDFLTPIGHQCNTLVMRPGGYRFSDYPRLGAPLSVIVIALGAPLIAHFWPLVPR
ncbi:MAG TPA: SLC13 family permease [Caulobacteraceae bacterium]